MAEDSLRRLLDLHALGHFKPHLVPSMAIEIWNVFCNSAMQRDLRKRKFPSPAMYKDGQKKELALPLVGFQLNRHPPGIAFQPILDQLGHGMKYDLQTFNTWWKKEVAHQPMRPPGEGYRDNFIDLTRFGLVRLIRNKIAAHHDRSRPMLIDELERSSLIGGWSFDMDGRTYRLDDGEFEVRYPYGLSVLRQIAFETLAGFNMIPMKLSADGQEGSTDT